MPRKTKIQIWKHEDPEIWIINIGKNYSIFLGSQTTEIHKIQPIMKILQPDWKQIAEN